MLRNFATFKLVTKQRNGRCLRDMYISRYVIITIDIFEFIHISAWASCCSFLTDGQCEGLEAWNEQ